jgi:hypothetical protein
MRGRHRYRYVFSKRKSIRKNILFYNKSKKGEEQIQKEAKILDLSTIYSSFEYSSRADPVCPETFLATSDPTQNRIRPIRHQRLSSI